MEVNYEKESGFISTEISEVHQYCNRIIVKSVLIKWFSCFHCRTHYSNIHTNFRRTLKKANLAEIITKYIQRHYTKIIYYILKNIQEGLINGEKKQCYG